jgi:hypothetical protein
MNLRMLSRSSLQKGLILALALGGIYFGYRNLQDTLAMTAMDGDHITPWEARFQPVKRLLPFKRGVVGYLTNSDILGTSMTSNEQGEYTLTQYAMSPIILRRGMEQDWIIAILDTRAYQIWNKAHGTGYQVYGLGDDLFLFHRLSQ